MPATTTRKSPIAKALEAQAKLDAQRDAKLIADADRLLRKPVDPATIAAIKLQDEHDAEDKARLLQEEIDAKNSIFAPPVVITPTPAKVPTPTQTVTKLATVDPDKKKTKKPATAKAVKEPKVKKEVAPKAPRAKKPAKPKASPMQDVKNYAYHLFKEITKSNAILTTKDMRNKTNNVSHFLTGLVLTRKADWFMLCDRLVAHAKDKNIAVAQPELIRG